MWNKNKPSAPVNMLFACALFIMIFKRFVKILKLQIYEISRQLYLRYKDEYKGKGQNCKASKFLN